MEYKKSKGVLIALSAAAVATEFISFIWDCGDVLLRDYPLMSFLSQRLYGLPFLAAAVLLMVYFLTYRSNGKSVLLGLSLGGLALVYLMKVVIVLPSLFMRRQFLSWRVLLNYLNTASIYCIFFAVAVITVLILVFFLNKKTISPLPLVAAGLLVFAMCLSWFSNLTVLIRYISDIETVLIVFLNIIASFFSYVPPILAYLALFIFLQTQRKKNRDPLSAEQAFVPSSF